MKRTYGKAFNGGASKWNNGNHKRQKRKEEDEEALEPLGKLHIPSRDWSSIKWSPEQLQVIDAVRQGRNVFVTGPGGVGKSTLLPYLVHIVQEEQDKIVRITATTGIAAVQIGGMTFHSFVGVGLGDGTQAEVIKSAMGSKQTEQRWTKVDTLVIDEISMMDPEFFIKADHIGRALRKDPLRAFGGMQLILVGDFFQLPPVITDKESRKTPYEFAFDTPSWWDLKLVNVELRTVFRQSDAEFVSALNRIRYGEPTPQDIQLLSTRVNAPLSGDAIGIEPTVLYSRSRNVEQMNLDRLKQLPGPDYVFDHKTGWIMDGDAPVNEAGGAAAASASATRPTRAVGMDLERYLKRLQADMLKNSPAEKTVILRKHAQVMLLINLDQEKGLVNGSRGVIVGFDDASKHPIVRFQNDVEMPISPHSWKRGEKGYGEVYYTQVPLKLAWAVTIHKSQGMTLDCSIMSIDSTLFERGQAYVALSRIRTLGGMRLTHFDPNVIRAHPRVVEFYKSGFEQPKHMTNWGTLKSFLSVDAMQQQQQQSQQLVAPVHASLSAAAASSSHMAQYFGHVHKP